MGILNFLFGSEPEKRTYVIILQASKPYGGSFTKKIELELTKQEAADMSANKAAVAKSLSAAYWPGAPDVKVNNGPTIKS